MKIINADDFGKDEMTTLAIAESFKHGYINQTTLMVNMPWAEKAVEIAKREGFADKVGLHLNLTESALGDKICMPANNDTLRAEMRSQISKYMSFNLPLLHCDSHHHVHFRLSVAFVLFPLLKRFGFKSVRRPYNISLGFAPGGMARHIRNGLLVSFAGANGLKTTRWFGGVSEIEMADDVEIMVHPVFASNGRLVNAEHFDRMTGRPLSGRPMSNLHGEAVSI